ncbi:MAG: hypothetical protein N0E56_15805 [Candidatus Thiodiazotropha endolucinida]|nr:hypothetical protein [Candidatus Thiodiazotropha taylori]MCW4268088.1 hypothetical protein [Candidatus Thiodiazotropha endolucinida]
MQPGKVKHKDRDLGTYQRPDGQSFKVTAKLYEMPAEYDYWLTTYDAEHEEWGHMRFMLTVPKKIAATIDLAGAIVSGTALDQVKQSLLSATEQGRDMAPCFAHDGWVLI